MENFMKRFYRPAMSLATLVTAAIVVTTLAVPLADAATKKQRHHVYTARGNTTSLSFDGRNTGRSRTCGFSTLQYDNRGIPYGPYCH
jgi:hypothetical protein